MVRYAKEMGKFLDTEESINEKTVKSFENSPNYNMEDYPKPEGGWKTFNEFFCRKVDPTRRPIAAPHDDTVIVSGADSTFDGQWQIRR